MDDRRERVDGVAVQEDVDLDEVCGLLAVGLVVERRVALGARLQRVEEVEDDLGQRQRVADLDPVLAEVVEAALDAATRLAQLEDGADVLGGRQDRAAHHRLVHLGDLALGVLRRVGDDVLAAVLHDDAVDHVGGRRDEVKVELALETLAHDLHVQQAEEADPEAEAERGRTLGLVGQRRVVELQLLERLAQFVEVVAVDRIEAGVDHRVGVPVATQVGLCRAVFEGDGVADAGLAHVLHAGDQVADLADAEGIRLDWLGRDDADLEQFVGRLRRHHPDALAVVEFAVDHADIGDDAAVGVVDGVEDQRARRGRRVADRRRDLFHDCVEQFRDALAGLAGDPQHVVGVAADDAREFLGVLLGVGAGQVDLVQHGDDVQVGLERQVQVRQRLRLDALSGVDEQDRALARLQRAGHLVGEVDVAGGVDHVEDVHDAVLGPGHPHGLGLDGDAALALDLHPVQVLGAHLPRVDHLGQLQHAVGKGRLAMIDVGDDAEVADDRRVGLTWARCWHRFPRGRR